MPAFTPNRLYPYSLPTDPADVPGALQDLAEAIDADVCALTNGVAGRPVSRFRGTTQFPSESPTHGVNSPPTPYADRIPFDTTDFNLANVTRMSADVGQRMLFPEDPGFYVCVAQVVVPNLTVAGASTLFLGLQIRRGDFTNPTSLLPAPRLSGLSNPASVSADDRLSRLMTCTAAAFMNGTTDAFSIEWRADTNPDAPQYVIADRAVTILKMTQS